jgi:RNA polymerase sigma-70 factor (ECF subfamily)
MTDPAEMLYERLLVLRCQTQDEAAFAEIVRRYDRRLRYFLEKMLPARTHLDDLLQDIWFDVFRAVPKLIDPAAFPAWLYRIARDRAFRLMRRAKPAPEALDDADYVDETAEDSFTPEDAAAVHIALDQLAPHHREVLLLRFIESMSYVDIAVITAVDLGTVRSRIHYAKHQLRQILERNPHEPARLRQ